MKLIESCPDCIEKVNLYGMRLNYIKSDQKRSKMSKYIDFFDIDSLDLLIKNRSEVINFNQKRSKLDQNCD